MIKKDRRWLKSVLAASAEPMPALPWARSTRGRPAAMKAAAPKPRSQAIAAR